jgi:acyl dehydratase
MILQCHGGDSTIAEVTRASEIAVGDVIPSFVRRTGLANWNRYAAVNDEFIDIHMEPEAARAVGMPDVFGMGNLRIAYLHNMLHDWLGTSGDIAAFRCEFRGLNFRGDTLTCTGMVRDRSGTAVTLDLSVVNQDGVDTTPGSANVVLFEGRPSMPPVPPLPEPSGEAAPGTFLDQKTIDMIGREMEPVTAPAVGLNDIRRWAMATYWPKPAPAVFLDEDVAAQSPWDGIVAPRDFDPFAWAPNRPWGGDWLWGMGTEPGKRILNGGQRNLYFEPIRPGDTITCVRRFVDVVERETKRGPMVFFTSEFRWTNQRDEPVRHGYQTSIYY